MSTVQIDTVLFGVLMALLAIETIAVVGGLFYVYGQNVYQTVSLLSPCVRCGRGRLPLVVCARLARNCKQRPKVRDHLFVFLAPPSSLPGPRSPTTGENGEEMRAIAPPAPLLLATFRDSLAQLAQDSKSQDSKVSDKHTAQSVEARRAHKTAPKQERASPKPLLIPAGDRAQSLKAAGGDERRGSILNRIFSGEMTSTPRDPDQKLWEVQATDIELVEVIGVGSCGKVWLANWLGSPCAVKKFDPKQISNTDEFLRFFMKEVELMSKLHHPNIVMFLGACTQPPNLYLMLELCVHGSLFDFLREKKHRIKITMDISVKLALDIARGVKYLHERCNIIQRDLKSANILIDGNLNAKVAGESSRARAARCSI